MFREELQAQRRDLLRMRSHVIVSDVNLSTILNRMARALHAFGTDAVQTRVATAMQINTQLCHLIHRKERVLLHLRRCVFHSSLATFYQFLNLTEPS